jgi:hypothetical protein
MPSLFKTVGAVLCLVFALYFAAPNAHADTETPTFTCDDSSCVSIPTAPNVSFPSPTSITETWNGITFTVPLAAGDVPSDSYRWANAIFACGACLTTGEALQFRLADTTTGDFPGGEIFNVTGAVTVDGGNLSFAPVATATPEPSSLAFTLSGVGLVFAMRKRLTSGLRQAS